MKLLQREKKLNYKFVVVQQRNIPIFFRTYERFSPTQAMNMEIATRFKCTSSIGYYRLHIKSKFLILLAIGQVNLENIGYS